MIEVEKLIKHGKTFYYIKGTKTLHREDGPAVIWQDGTKFWYYNGKRHREDGPAYIEKRNGYKEWYNNGKLHREDGPARERHDGIKAWYLNGKCHRLDGPAVISNDGEVKWYLNGIPYSKEKWFEELTEEQKEKALYSEYFIRS
jgi:hypothetical protein